MFLEEQIRIFVQQIIFRATSYLPKKESARMLIHTSKICN